MPKQSSKGSGGTKKYGRNTSKCRYYRERNTRERNKLKKILRSNGHKAAVAYAHKHGLQEPKNITKERSKP